MITYRIATIDDLELLTRTRVDFFADIHKDITDGEKADIYAYSKAYFEETLGNGTFAAYLAFDEEVLVATSGVNFYKTPPNPKNTSGKMAYISNMYTKPEYRDRGITTHLFDLTAAEARGRGCGKAVLHATEIGRTIYEKYGFFVPSPYGAMEYYFEK